MSEKHLTELPWKTLVTKQKLKDPGLGKALADYGKCTDADHNGKLKALDAVEKQATDLKKTVKENKEAKDYVDDVLAESAKVRKAVELLKKGDGKEKEAEGGEEEEDDGAVDPASVKRKMLGLLAQVKRWKEGDPALGFMAGIAGNDCAVLLGKTVGATQRKQIGDMMPGASGMKYVSGACIWEENAYTFVLESAPSGLAKHLRVALLLETGGNFKVRVKSADGSVVEGAGEDTEESTATGDPQTGPNPAELWKKLKAELYPDIKPTLDANPPNRDEIIKLAAAASQHEKAGNFPGAIEDFTKLRPLLKGVTQTRGGDGDELAAPFKLRLKALAPDLQRALKEQLGDAGKIRAVAEFAREKAGVQNFKAALQALDALEKLLAAGGLGGGAPQTGTGQLGTPPKGIVAQRKFLLERWKLVPGELRVELAGLQTAIATQLPEEDAAELVSAMDLNLQDFTDELQDEIDAGINAGDMSRLKGLKARVSAQPLIAHLLGTPFVKGSKFETVLLTALTDIEQNLAA